MASEHTRPAAVAGMFYPDDPMVLSATVEGLLSRSSSRIPAGRIVGLIAPHAGYEYSGYTAATAYNLLNPSTPATVVIISPSHREYFNGISVYDGDAYETPLGAVPVDTRLRTELLNLDPSILASATGHRREHAIEVHLPFLQEIFTTFSILPIVMGDQRRELCFGLGKTLGRLLQTENVLLVASTDLSHYHAYDEANALDRVMIDDIAAFDYEKLMADLENDRTEACGGGPTIALLLAASLIGASRVEILHHCNSGDITGDRDGVVGYVSAAILKD